MGSGLCQKGVNDEKWAVERLVETGERPDDGAVGAKHCLLELSWAQRDLHLLLSPPPLLSSARHLDEIHD